MTFIYNWFDVAALGNFDRFLSPLKGNPNLSFLEIGCFEGRATDWMLRNILTDVTSKITVCDPFTGSDYYLKDGIKTDRLQERFEENVAHSKEKVTIKKGFSQETLRGFDLNNQFDFIYVDGSHKAGDTLEDAILAFRLLKTGGIMIFDDYKWCRFPEEPLLNPGVGIDAFLSIFADKIEVLLQDYQVVVKKK